MVRLAHASDTPRLGDTSRYGNITLVDSQVSQLPLEGSRAAGEVWPHDPGRNLDWQTATFLSVYRRDEAGLESLRSDAGC